MNLISKKDLLAITGISYGQLYRWKRERLIPEEWFIKQSAYTGQETFFPREQIISRINSILELKDLYSLEELAKILSPETSVSRIQVQDLKEVEELDQGLLEVLSEVYSTEGLGFYELALAVGISQAAKRLNLSQTQAAMLFKQSTLVEPEQKSINLVCTIFYTGEEYHTLFTANASILEFDARIEIKEQISLSEITDMIKLKYRSFFVK